MSTCLKEVAASRAKSNNFDAQRAFFATLVMFSHSYSLLRRGNATEPFYRLSGGQMAGGDVAVDAFFIISGYLISISWERSSGLFDYLRRRFLRIYPGFLCAVLFSSLIAGPLISGNARGYFEVFDFGTFVTQAFNLGGAYAPGVTTNGSLWSIRYEFLCYLAVIGLSGLGFFRWRYLLLLATLGCTLLQALQEHAGLKMPGSSLSWFWSYPGNWPRLGGCFLAGALFHVFGDRIVLSRALALACLAGLGLGLVHPPAKAFPLLLPYLGGYLIFAAAYAPAGSLKDIARRGDLTYGLYLYAFPVQQVFIRHLGDRLTPLLLFAATLLATVPLAALSWHIVERPCQRLKRHSSTARAGLAAPVRRHLGTP